MSIQLNRRLLIQSAVGVGAAGLLAACSDNASLPATTPTASPTAKAISQDAYDKIVLAGPLADAAAIAASPWAQKIKSQGYIRRGGTDTGAIFSLKNPTTGRVAGFDAGIGDLLARYITGGQDVAKLTQLSLTTVDTRETMLQNNTVDVVVATYTITAARATKINFAGPYYSSGAAIQVKSDNTTIKSVSDLDGKTIVTQSNSTGITAIDEHVKNATKLLLADNDSCIAALVQGRADAYVLDQAILLSNAVKNPQVKVVGDPFTVDPYGVGINKDDATAKAFVNTFLQNIFDSGVWLDLWKATVGLFVEGSPKPPVLGSVTGS